MKIIIVGTVAGGASCAARLRRLDQTTEILMVERGPYVSSANCGLPYHIGGVIEKESSLPVANENTFRNQFVINVRTRCEVIGIAPEMKTVRLRDVATGEVTTEAHDKLVLSPGTSTIRPPQPGIALPGIDLPGIFEVRTVPDARVIRDRFLWRRGGLDRRQREDAPAAWQRRLQKKSTCTRTRTPATTRARGRSR
ncbi:FAD-dependent oxidoreductase [Candidatus Competibacter phosphatis]|uniref:FAD-dependent oxidoreductase n=1 Tax=Candidatus Competibacter phosphatis TaxID=221280 RepID=UPI0028AB8C96|nr:FAD-dependent oxidoreductase [Candidatus Competibacter phosphatis]